jgi:hypothetical protein
MLHWIMKLANSLQDEQGFHMNSGLDQSPVFECPCCIPRPEEDPRQLLRSFESEADHHICMILKEDAWRTGDEYDSHKGFCDLVVLKACEEVNMYERVGFVRVRNEYSGNTKTLAEAHETWDGLSWGRRELKLI